MRQIRKGLPLLTTSSIVHGCRASCLFAFFLPSSILMAIAQGGPGSPNIAPVQLPAPVNVLYTFTAATNHAAFGGYTNVEGAFCTAALVQDSDGNLYGVAPTGGDFGNGTVFSLNTNGTALTVLHVFSAFQLRSGLSNPDGGNPTGLMLGLGGRLYGTASQGGTNGSGVIFQLNTDGSGFTNLRNFDPKEGGNPQGGLVQGPDGTLYGTTQNGGTDGSGTVFSLTSDGSAFTVLYNFTVLNNGTNADGMQPYGGLALASDGTLYGTARYGGPSGSVRTFAPERVGSGTIFSLKTNGTGFTVLHSFDTFSGDFLQPTNSDGASPYSALILGNDGRLYGTAPEAGQGASGTIFGMDTDGGNYTVLHAFDYIPHSPAFSTVYGLYPFGGLVQARDGLLYGAAYGGGFVPNGGYFAGTLYRLNTDGDGLALLHSFASPDSYTKTNADGANPYATLLKGNDGRLYGVTSSGGTNASGTIFSFAPPVVLGVANSNHVVRLSWPISATNFVLETCTTLSSSSVWTPLTNDIAATGYTFTLTLPATNGNAFFRLHHP